MRAIVIAIPDEGDPEDFADFVKYVGSQLDEGFMSGHVNSEQYWSIEDDK